MEKVLLVMWFVEIESVRLPQLFETPLRRQLLPEFGNPDSRFSLLNHFTPASATHHLATDLAADYLLADCNPAVQRAVCRVLPESMSNRNPARKRKPNHLHLGLVMVAESANRASVASSQVVVVHLLARLVALDVAHHPKTQDLHQVVPLHLLVVVRLVASDEDHHPNSPVVFQVVVLGRLGSRNRDQLDHRYLVGLLVVMALLTLRMAAYFFLSIVCCYCLLLGRIYVFFQTSFDPTPLSVMLIAGPLLVPDTMKSLPRAPTT
jgi:hypothetical protein